MQPQRTHSQVGACKTAVDFGDPVARVWKQEGHFDLCFVKVFGLYKVQANHHEHMVLAELSTNRRRSVGLYLKPISAAGYHFMLLEE
jgi:hypothetical protein